MFLVKTHGIENTKRDIHTYIHLFINSFIFSTLYILVSVMVDPDPILGTTGCEMGIHTGWDAMAPRADTFTARGNFGEVREILLLLSMHPSWTGWQPIMGHNRTHIVHIPWTIWKCQ